MFVPKFWFQIGTIPISPSKWNPWCQTRLFAMSPGLTLLHHKFCLIWHIPTSVKYESGSYPAGSVELNSTKNTDRSCLFVSSSSVLPEVFLSYLEIYWFFSSLASSSKPGQRLTTVWNRADPAAASEWYHIYAMYRDKLIILLWVAVTWGRKVFELKLWLDGFWCDKVTWKGYITTRRISWWLVNRGIWILINRLVIWSLP